MPLAGRRPQPGPNPISPRFHLAGLRPIPGPNTPAKQANQHSNLTRAGLFARGLASRLSHSAAAAAERAPCPPCSAPTDGRTHGSKLAIAYREFPLRCAPARHDHDLHCTAPTRPTPLAGARAAHVSRVSLRSHRPQRKAQKPVGKCGETGVGKKKAQESAGAAPSKVSAPAADAAGLRAGAGAWVGHDHGHHKPWRVAVAEPSPRFPPATTRDSTGVVCLGRGAVFLPVSRTCSSQCNDDPSTTPASMRDLEHDVYRTAPAALGTGAGSSSDPDFLLSSPSPSPLCTDWHRL